MTRSTSRGGLGDSALALELLQRGLQPDEELAKRFHTPSARVDVGSKLAERQQATAMLDISDGLLADLGHILAASGVGCRDRVGLPAIVPVLPTGRWMRMPACSTWLLPGERIMSWSLPRR